MNRRTFLAGVAAAFTIPLIPKPVLELFTPARWGAGGTYAVCSGGYEMLIYDRVLSFHEMALVHDYLDKKWGFSEVRFQGRFE